MNFFKEITSILGWLSGAVAGIAAIFYGCGYLIKRAHLNLLGISALFSFSQELYMQEGARFVADMTDLLALIFLPLLMFAISIVAVGFLLQRTGLRRQFDAARRWLAAFAECRPMFCRCFAYAATLVFLLFLTDRGLKLFAAPLAVSDLLFTPSPAASGSNAASIRDWLLAGDRSSLDSIYERLTLFVLTTGALLLVAWRLVEPWRLRVLLTAPFALVFLLSLLMLPMAYGVLKRPARFPRVAVASDQKMLASVRGDLYLLDKTGDEFILWDAAARRVIWLPRDEVHSAEIGQSRFIFGSTSTTTREVIP